MWIKRRVFFYPSLIVSTKTDVENEIQRLTVQKRSAQTNLAINDTENYEGMDKSVHTKTSFEFKQEKNAEPDHLKSVQEEAKTDKIESEPLKMQIQELNKIIQKQTQPLNEIDAEDKHVKRQKKILHIQGLCQNNVTQKECVNCDKSEFSTK